MLGDAHTNYDSNVIAGYLMALCGAFLWALYSNLRRLDRADPVASMTLICMAPSAFCMLAAAADGAALETPDWNEIVTIVLLGLGPAGSAFFLWDLGMKRGNVAALAIFSYSAPIISTILMVLVGFGEARWNVALAAFLIAAGGAVVGLRDRTRAYRRGPEPRHPARKPVRHANAPNRPLPLMFRRRSKLPYCCAAGPAPSAITLCAPTTTRRPHTGRLSTTA